MSIRVEDMKVGLPYEIRIPSGTRFAVELDEFERDRPGAQKRTVHVQKKDGEEHYALAYISNDTGEIRLLEHTNEDASALLYKGGEL